MTEEEEHTDEAEGRRDVLERWLLELRVVRLALRIVMLAIRLAQ